MISVTKEIRQQFADTMLEVGTHDPKLVVVVGDISHFKLQPFAQACPDRFYNIGILEPTMVSMSAGLAKVGFYPAVHTIAPFLIERSYEQLKLDFGYQSLPGNIITVGSSFDYSNLGCTHHCYGDFALMKSIPGTQITFPASAVEFDALFKQTYNNESLTTFRVPARSHGHEFLPSDIVFGKAIRVAEGTDLTLVVTGPELGSAIQTRRRLGLQGWSIEIIYVHTVSPLDRTTIFESVAKTRRVLVVEEHTRSGGLGSDVLETVYKVTGLQFAHRCLPERFIRAYGHYEQHLADLGFDENGLSEMVLTQFTK